MYNTTRVKRDRVKKRPSTSLPATSVSHENVASKSSTELSKVPLSQKQEFSSEEHEEFSEPSPVVSYIVHCRTRLGMKTFPEKDLSTKDMTAKSITGVKDLKLLSKRMHSMTTQDVHHALLYSGDFVNCLTLYSRNQHLRYDPYALEIVPAELARQYSSHYTVGAYTVAQVEKDGGIADVLSVTRWLWERETFHRLSKIPFFANFKIWKAFSLWKGWITRHKWKTHRLSLCRNLLSADTLLQQTILEVRMLCEKFSSSGSTLHIVSDYDGISLIDIDQSNTCSLDEFILAQTLQMKVAKDRLMALYETVESSVHKTCQSLAKRENIGGLLTDSTEEPLHSEVLEWRGALERLRAFVKLCDFIILDFLQRLVMKAVCTIEWNITNAEQETKPFVKKQVQEFDAMWSTVLSQPHIIDLKNHTRLDEDENMGDLKMEQDFSRLMPEALYNPLYTDACEDSGNQEIARNVQDDLLHVVAELFKEKQKKRIALWKVDLVLKKQEQQETVQPLFEVSIKPLPDDFKQEISKLFDSYLDLISSFPSLLDSEMLKPYISRSKYDLLMLLEDSDQKDQSAASHWPFLQMLLYEYQPYMQCVKGINLKLQNIMTEIEKYSKNYSCFSRMVESSSIIDVTSSLKKKEWFVGMFQNALAFFHDQVHGMQHMLQSFHVGMMRVDVKSFQEHVLSFPMQCIKELEYHLPKLAHEKCDAIIRNIKVSVDKLQTLPHNVELFVHYLHDVQNVTESLNDTEEKMTTVSKLYSVAQEFDISVGSEELALYHTIFSQFRHLRNVLLQAEATKVENVRHFSSDLKADMIAVLHEAQELKTKIESLPLAEDSEEQELDLGPLQTLKKHQIVLTNLLTQAKNYLSYHQMISSISTSRRNYYHVDSISQYSWTPEEVYEEVQGIQQSLDVRKHLLESKKKWSELVVSWNKEQLKSLDIDKLQSEVNSYVNTLDYLEKGLPFNPMVSALADEVLAFKSLLPTLSCLLNPVLRIRHWDAIEQCTGHWFGKESETTLGHLQEIQIFEHHNEIVSVSNQANHEATLESMLTKLSMEWVSKEFTLVPYTTTGNRQTFLLGGVEDLFSSLEDSLTTLGTIKNSKYVAPVKHAVIDWESRLTLLMEVVEQWVLCQKNWLYLESIFASMDIQRQLSKEAKLFQRADKSWRDVINIISDKATALKSASTSGVLEAFQSCNALLEQVFRSLENYMESKRMSFPRLYFISDNELLDILSHIRSPHAILPYLSKMFANIRRLEFSKEVQVSPPVKSMLSVEGEKVDLKKPFPARGSPEQWLGVLETSMMDTVKKFLSSAILDYDALSRCSWVMNHPGQAVLAAAQVDWCQQVECCLKSTNSARSQLKGLYKTWVDHLNELAVLTRVADLSLAQKSVVTALLTLDVHSRDILHSLIKEHVSNCHDFEWIRHLRYYWEVDSMSCTLQHCNYCFPYGYEYLGCLPRLVMTPLSERCYLTLTTALHLHLGGSPIGPAGTGKSETVKDLSKAMGKLCLVFNCSEGLDYKMIGRFLTGLCQSGLWCCFDEFNRINVEVLSVVAHQLQSIKAAKDNQITRFLFEGKEVKLVPSCAAFITMNPSYAGRVELPNNVKALFRPVAMVAPDTQIIAEVLLFANGFTTAPMLAVKLTKLYDLACTQLSNQIHYDFGLRAVKAVVTLARDYLQHDNSGTEKTLMERKALLRSIKDCSQPKLLLEDAHSLRLLVYDVFNSSTYNFEENDTKVLEDCIKITIEELHLETCSSQIQKCLGLYTTLLIHHGVMVLGPTGTGKTTVCKLLNTALNKIHESYYRFQRYKRSNPQLSRSSSFICSLSEITSCSEHCQVKTINPKCLSIGELYGHHDPHSLEWCSGILGKALQVFSKKTECALDAKFQNAADEMSHATEEDGAETEEISTGGMPYPSAAPVGWKWIVLDGPVDPGWIENLNSTLDDSKLLCLANGERVEVAPGVRILFETDSLLNASPATISRCGMVYLDESQLGWKPYVLSWLNSITDNLFQESKSYLFNLFERSVEEGMQFLSQHASELSCEVSGMSALSTLCYLLQCFLENIAKEHQMLSTSTKDLTRESEKYPYSNIPSRQLSHSRSIFKKSSSFELMVPFLLSNPERLNELLGKVYVFAFTWAFGGNFETSDVEQDFTSSTGQSVTRGGISARAKFDALVHKVFQQKSGISVKLPTSADLIHSYYVDISSCSFVPWERLVPSSQEFITQISLSHRGVPTPTHSSTLIDAESFVDQINAYQISLVPTQDILQLSFFALALLKAGHHVLISGKLGVGKSQLLAHISNIIRSKGGEDSFLSLILGTSHCEQYEKEDLDIIEKRMSLETSVSQIQNSIGAHLVRKGKSLLSPSADKLLVCLDDLNATLPDEYGSHPCAEFLRQLLGSGGWYERKSLVWKSVEKVCFLTTSSKNYSKLNERCLSRFSTFCLPEPSTCALTHIYSTRVIKYFMSHKFSAEVISAIGQSVRASIHTYYEVRANLLPSPVAPQYIFCTKDLTKVFTGLLRVNSKSLQTAEDLMFLTCHELARVFHDCCLQQDREKVLEILSEALRIHYKSIHSPSQLKEQICLWEGFMSDYAPIKNMKRLMKHLERAQNQYNTSQDKNMKMVFFPLACEHIVRAARVLQQECGHMIMLGNGGVGRRSCIELASYLVECQYHVITPGYKSCSLELMEDVKTVLLECGVKNSPCVLVIGDLAGQDSCHLINNLVLGEFDGIYEKEEMDCIIHQLAEQSETDLSINLWKTFTDRSRQNLHLVLCFSPSSHELVYLCKTCPGLVTHTTVNVYDDWLPKALYGVATRELHIHEVSNSDLAPFLKDAHSQIASVCVKIHGSVVSTAEKSQRALGHTHYVTPSTFIQFVQSTCKILKSEHQRIRARINHLEAGQCQFTEADNKVSMMRTELKELKPKIDAKAMEVEELMSKLSAEQEEMDLLKQAVDLEHRRVAMETKHIAELTADAESNLKAVLPALEEAEKGLNSLKKSDLLEIRSYSTPPSMVVHVMSAVCVLLQESTEWNKVKHLMAEPVAFLRQLTEFNKNNVPEKVFSKLENYTSDPNFTPGNVAHYSVACQSFCQWVLAIQHYGRVYKLVEPKRLQYQELEIKLEKSKKDLAAKEFELKELRAQLDALKEQYSAAVDERNELQKKCALIAARLERSDGLKKSLGDEQIRWQEALSTLQTQSKCLLGDSILSAACFVYSGAFTPSFRQSLLGKWKHTIEEANIAISAEFSMESRMMNPEQVQEWHAQGLPKDLHSVQNAILIMMQSEKPSFVIDPESQAISWLKESLKKSGITFVPYSSSQLTNILEHCVRAGLPVVVQNVPENLGPMLNPFVTKKFISQSGKVLLKVGKTEIDYNSSFRLFLVSNVAEVNLTSETCINTRVINFSATFEGLQDQLLSIVINLEEPDVEMLYNELHLSISNDQKQLKSLENQVLEMLQTSEGNILDNEGLVKALHQTKKVALEVEDHLLKAQATQKELNTIRSHYRPVATRGSVLYFCLFQLKRLNYMYQYSLEWFQDIFSKCIKDVGMPVSKQESDMADFIRSINSHLTEVVFEYTAIGLLSEDFLPFAFTLSCSILMRHEDLSKASISSEEWSFFSQMSRKSKQDGHTDNLSSPKHSRKKHSSISDSVKKPDFVTDQKWIQLKKLELSFKCFRHIQTHISEHHKLWKSFMSSDDPLRFKPPLEMEEHSQELFVFDALSLFQKLILVKLLCKEHLAAAVKAFIELELGPSFGTKPALNLKHIVEESDTINPFIFILSHDADPGATIQMLAEQILGNMEHVHSISLGQGQGEKAKDLIHFGAKNGRWVFLQNCHLAASWMPQLEKVTKCLSDPETDKRFRLWLSSKPSEVVPLNIVQSSMKISLDPPQTMKTHLQQMICTETSLLSKDTFESNMYGKTWRSLLFGLCFFHAAVNGRKACGTMGWNAPYSFNSLDFQVSVQLLQSVLSDLKDVSWKAFHYLIGRITYGGKITNRWDLCCLDALVKKFCNPELLEANDEMDVFVIKPDTAYDECKEIVSKLPSVDSPDMYGLHQSVGCYLESSCSEDLDFVLMKLESVVESKRAVLTRNIHDILEKCSELKERLPLPIGVPSVLDMQKMSSPFSVLLSKEIAIWNQRLLAMTASLHSLEEALKGGLHFRNEVEELYKAIEADQAPMSWKKIKSRECCIEDWLESLTKENNFITKWVAMNDGTEQVVSLPKKFSLSLLQSPEGFLMTVCQDYSRKTGISMEDVQLNFQVLSAPREEKVCEDGVVITGLSLEGAQWGDGGLIDVTEKTEYQKYFAMPDIICYPLKKRKEAISGFYHCPLYSDPERKHFIATIPLPASLQPGHWSLCGTALFV